MYYINEDEVRSNLTMKETIDVIREAFEEYRSGRASSNTRVRTFSEGSVLNTMPASMEKYHIMGHKTYSASKNGARFVVTLFDSRSNDLIAIVEANRLGQMRTGAVTAYATSILHPSVENFTLIGSGFQAETQLEGMLVVSHPRSIRVYSRNHEHAKDFASRMAKKFGVDVRPVDNAEAAISGADTISSITNSVSPIILRKYLGSHYHINLAGSNYMNRREAEYEVLHDADLVVTEHYDQSMVESAEISEYVRFGGKPLELREIAGRYGEFSDLDRTVFKSMGIGLEDIATAYRVLRNMGLA
ncbi:ornithine cyclodeaminase [Thermoplasma sp.]|uniref:ornithine cyclodeaminase n=1 Tax=Thermoplasma sp. TaxID=1973142 RepID=UPI0012753D11|nr:ornithine cyclodeaminase [Thermoplasma sp.]KAA8923387.1 MAG: ornithine cyclodeaminase [Thermoplasma sp.]